MSSSNPSSAKKSLRRRPPPELPSQHPHSAPPVPTFSQPIGPASDYLGYADSMAIEEQIINISTPRPMGPKELPQYTDEYPEMSNRSFGSNSDSTFVTPYPLNDPVNNFYSQEDLSYNDRKADIFEQSLKTPTKIPALDVNSLSVDGSPTLHSMGSGRTRTPSPERYNSFSGRQQTKSSPFLRANTINTSLGRSSRSPSPKKIYGRSPSLMYEFDDQPFTPTYEDTEFQEYTEPDTTLTNEPYYPEQTFNDEYDYESEEQESPTSRLFDYSILPDIPSTSTISNDGNGSPTKRMTLHSAISFVKGNGYFDDEPVSGKITNRKKNDRLPPVPLDLPALPFTSSSLMSRHFAACSNVWSLSEVFGWCVKLKGWLHDSFISKKEFKKALIKLLVYHRRNVPLDTVGPNVDQIIANFLHAGAISLDYGTLPNKDGEKALPNPTGEERRATTSNPRVMLYENAKVSGVLIELTSCYCYTRNHEDVSSELTANGVKLRCLSSQCYLNRVIDYEVQFRSTDISEIILGEDWASHWKLSADDLKKFDKDVSKKQSLLFDLLRYEQTFIQRAKLFVEIVGPEFVKAVRTLLGSSEIISMTKFDEDVINPGRDLLQIHQKSLFEPLLKILISNGKFIRDVSDIGEIYYNWSQVARSALLKYMGTVPMIEELLSIPSIKQWVDVDVRNMPKVKSLRVNGPLLLMSTFNSRYQQLPLQLSDILNQFDEQDAEHTSIQKAIDGIKKTAAKVNDMKKHADNIQCLKRIQKQLVWKHNIMKPNINYGSENRCFIHRGDVTRKGDLRINSSVNHLILLDNYLLITDRVKSSKSLMINYRVIENAIPIEFLLLEIKEKETPTIELNTITKLTQSPQQPTNRNELINNEEDPSIYPFKIRYAGHGKNNAFVFSTKTERERTAWVDHFMNARSKLCSRLSRVEPYKLKVISNTCFAYEEPNRITKLQTVSENDPIEKMSQDSVTTLKHLGYNGNIYNFDNSVNHVIYSSVLAATKFIYKGTTFYFIGTSSGVYCCDMTHEWKRVVSVYNTTKITVLTAINLAVMLNGNNLRYYPLDVLISYYHGTRDSISSLALSNEAVSFFEVGKHREITMLFYAKKKSGSSGATNFKVCIPETDNDGIFSSFKVVKKFYVQAECFGISIFNTSFAVHTSKGIEILELDKLLPRSVPDIPNFDQSSIKKIDGFTRRPASGNTPEIESIRKTIYSTSCKAMGMFKLNNSTEFLLVYNECAVFINKHGKLSRNSQLKFNFRAKSICFHDNNLILVCDEAIEAWSISDFVKGTNRLTQVVVGKDIKLLNSQGFVLCCMANPLVPGLQLVFELLPKQT